MFDAQIPEIFLSGRRGRIFLPQLPEVVPRQKATCGLMVGDGSPIHLF